MIGAIQEHFPFTALLLFMLVIQQVGQLGNQPKECLSHTAESVKIDFGTLGQPAG